MKKLFSIAIMAIALTISAGSTGISLWKVGTDLNVGKQPLTAVPAVNSGSGLAFMLYCGGADMDYDGIQDPSDETPSLWAVVRDAPGRGTLSTVKLGDLDFYYAGYPFRPAVDKDTMYFATSGKLEKFWVENESDPSNLQLRRDSIAAISAIASSINERRLYLAYRPNYSDPGYTVVYDLDSKQFFDTIKCGINVQQTVFNGHRAFTLNEGVYGGTQSSITVSDISGYKSVVIKTIDLGASGANHLAVQNGVLLITMNLTNEVISMDCETYETVVRTKFEAPAYGGPRETLPLDNETALVSVFTGYVYRINFLDGIIIDSSACFGKPEGITLSNDHSVLFAASPFDESGYNYADRIRIFSNFVSVDDQANENATGKAYPSPATDYVILPAELLHSSANANIEVFNSTGNSELRTGISPENISNSSVKLDISSLVQSGVYFAKIVSGESSVIIPFTVVR